MSKLIEKPDKQLNWQQRAIRVLSHLSVLTALAMSSVPANANNSAGNLMLTTVDSSGRILEHVVVSLHSPSLTAGLPLQRPISIMDQKQLQFAPGVLAVQSGTIVEFPNQDDVRHHVYSFSHPNAFELKLYHGESTGEQTFEHEGVVVLGCNIHDGMIGYLRVVDTPLFETSDANGAISFNGITPGDYELQVWHPDLGMRINRQPITIDAGDSRKILQVTTKMQAAPDIKAAHPLQSLFGN